MKFHIFHSLRGVFNSENDKLYGNFSRKCTHFNKLYFFLLYKAVRLIVSEHAIFGKGTVLAHLVVFTARKRSLGQGNMFTSVCLSMGGGVLPQHALQVVSQHALQQVSRWGVLSQHALQVVSEHALQQVSGRCLVWGVPAPGGCLVWGACSGGLPGRDPPRMATAAGGTHPTVMHSCLQYFIVLDSVIVIIVKILPIG